MPGKIWSDEERAQLAALRAQGLTVEQIVADPTLLPGRTLDSINQLKRRGGMTDPEASARAKAVVHFNAEQHTRFCEYIRANKSTKLAKIVSGWNNSAEQNGCPKVSRKTFTYWIEKLRVERPAKVVGRQPRRSKNPKTPEQRKAERFDKRIRELEDRRVTKLAESIKSAETFHRKHRKIEIVACGCCKTPWPLHTDYFAKLPCIFGFDGKLVDEYQTEFCLYCDWRVANEVELFRRYGKDVESLVDLRKEQRRRGIDKAFEKQLAEARARRDTLFARSKKLIRRTCIRCPETWPLDGTHFMLNRGSADGKPTYRALCTFCDHFYMREIDRLKRGGLGTAHLVTEREQWLRLARDNQRKASRLAARTRRDDLLNEDRTLPTKACSVCRDHWITDRKYAAEFWCIGKYVPRRKKRSTIYISKECICCRADKAAKQRREV